MPSRLEEQSHGFQGPWVGWEHHHWLIDVGPDAIEFVFKHHMLHGRSSDHFPRSFPAALSAEQRVQTLWWTGSFEGRERVIVGAEELEAYLSELVARHAPAGGRARWARALLSLRAARSRLR